MTNEKQDALRALEKMWELVIKNTYNSNELHMVLGGLYPVIKRALTEAPKVDVDARELTEETWKAIGQPSFSWSIIKSAIDHLTTHYDLVKKESK